MLVKIDGVPASQFLNTVFIWLEERNTGFISVIAYGFFAYYMLWACMKGNIKFGLRCFCFTFYPMLPNETFMNSFIVNVLLFNLWSVALTHFCTITFSAYARLTDANLIFGVQLQYMNFFKYFWEKNVFIYLLVIWAGLTAIYLMFKPSDRVDILKLVLLSFPLLLNDSKNYQK